MLQEVLAAISAASVAQQSCVARDIKKAAYHHTEINVWAERGRSGWAPQPLADSYVESNTKKRDRAIARISRTLGIEIPIPETA